MRRLRAPGGCPWDQEQTHASLRPYLLEEAAEAVDAIAEGDPNEMVEELGDVLLQVAFHAVIAEESGAFDYSAIERTLVDKLIRRHPHVFADTQVTGSAEVLANWQAIKRSEKPAREEGDPAAKVPRSLSALMRAYELGKVLDWPLGSAEQVREALEPNLDEDALGALLLAVTDYARAHGLNPEPALRRAANTRAKRVAAVEES